VSPAQVLEVTGASALGRHPLGVDLRRPAAGWGSFHAFALPWWDGPSGRRQLFTVCSLFGKTERHVNFLFF
jgi:hypothetical protein